MAVAAEQEAREETRAPLPPRERTSWRYTESGPRDVRLDLLRGYAVFGMVVNHVAEISWISPFTGANRFVVSAAEGFVFLAGLVMGMVYGRRIERDGWLIAAQSILRRATILYAATVSLTLLFVALFQFTTLRLWLDRSFGLGLTDPIELVVGTLTLHYTYHGTDILWMYTILIAASPFIFLALTLGHTRTLLLGSWFLWLAYQFFPSQAAIPWVATNVNYFPVSAWQILFVNGLVMGYHRESVERVLGRIPTRWALVAFSMGLGLLIVLHRAHETGRLAAWPIVGRLAGEAYLAIFDKPTVAIGRLAAFVILAGFAYSLVTEFWVPIRRALGWLLLPLGRNSLPAYAVHLVIIVVVYNIDPLARLYDVSRTGNTVLQVVTLGLTWVAVLAWQRVRAGVAWRPTLPAWPVWVPHPHRRAVIGVASLLVVAVTLAGALAGPVRGSRQANLASPTAEAGVLRYIPATAAARGPLTVLLALHGEGQTGPDFAAPLIDLAAENGWALVAPTIPFAAERADSESIAAVVAETLPRIRALVDELDERAGVSIQPRILVLGGGRGAHTARLFALFYPDVVAAVATVGPAPCIIPAAHLRGTALPVPFGVDDLEQYVGHELDVEALRRTAFWVGFTEDPEDPSGMCRWGALRDLPPAERTRVFAETLRELGSEVQTVSFPRAPSGDPLQVGALAFLRAHAEDDD